MVQILQRADAREIGTFRDAAQAHHDIFRKYYHMTVKTHVAIHIVDYWERWLQLLSCFSAERNHKLFKRICNFSYRKSGKNALAYHIATWMRNLSDATLYMETHLLGKTHPWGYVCVWPGLAQPVCLVRRGARLQTGMGQIVKGDLVQYVHDDMQCFGLVLGVGSTDCVDPGHVVVVQPCAKTSPTNWLPQEGAIALVNACAVTSVAPFIRNGAELLPMVSAPR